ncbi:MAG: cell division protein FtsZ [Deltaproteobacteria bacterium]|nr:cell division protein FtsZ [Deltaproteobacteria bacterium]
MSKKLELIQTENLGAKIKVIGVGGGGGNAVNTMISEGLTGVEFIAANTDAQALKNTLAGHRIQLGAALTKGLGAGANPAVAREAALGDTQQISELLDGCDMVFVTCGLGGGTGTGAAPVIAQIAKSMGILTVGVVTKPFIFEGKRRRRQADEGLVQMRENVDTLITIPNQRLLTLASNELTLLDAFRKVDQVLLSAVKGISDLINIHGMVNVDFADVRTVMSEMGMALMGTGEARGDNRAVIAAQNAISSPLLEDVSIEGATGILINITGTSSMTLYEVNAAATLVQEAAHEDANIIFGSVIDDTLGDKIRVTVIATGFNKKVEAITDLETAAPSAVAAKVEARAEATQPLNIQMQDTPVAPALGQSRPRRGIPLFEEESFDVPTFLRKGVE